MIRRDRDVANFDYLYFICLIYPYGLVRFGILITVSDCWVFSSLRVSYGISFVSCSSRTFVRSFVCLFLFCFLSFFALFSVFAVGFAHEYCSINSYYELNCL